MAVGGALWMVVVGGFVCVLSAWGIGANDIANSFGAPYGAKALTMNQSLLIAAVFEFVGAFALGSHVSETIRKGIVELELYPGLDGRKEIMAGMFCALCAATLWQGFATKFSLPVSTTHSIVGGVLGFAIVSRGYGAPDWEKIGMIVASWLLSPVLSCCVAGMIHMALMKPLVLDRPDPFAAAAKAAPLFAGLAAALITLFLVYKGLKGLGVNDTPLGIACLIALGVGVASGLAAIPFHTWYAAKIRREEDEAAAAAPDGGGAAAEGGDGAASLELAPAVTKGTDIDIVVEDAAAAEAPTPPPKKTLEEGGGGGAPGAAVGAAAAERVFVPVVVFVSCILMLSHGGNDVANAIGPFNGIRGAFLADVAEDVTMPLWLLALGAAGMAFGIVTYGHKVMKTIGEDITPLTPTKAYTVNLAAAITVLFCTLQELPVSTTHACVGATVAVGLVEGGGGGSINRKVIAKTALSWVLTVPIAAFTTSALYGILLPTILDLEQ